MEPKEDELENLKNLVYEEGGFDCSPYSKKFMKRKFKNRMRLNNIKSYKEYANFLKNNPGEFSKLIDAIKIPVTEFFRDQEVYEDFETVVLPELVSTKEQKKQNMIRFWSAGCASGEEPYSIAMSAKEVLGDKLDRFNLRIHGTDIDEEAIEKAKNGIYSEDDVEGVPRDYLNKYFNQKDGEYEVKHELKRIVRIKKHNLVSDDPLTGFDVIFCRNMLIYFSKETHAKIHMRLFDSLRDKGYLIIGKTELLHGEPRDKFEPVTKNRIYQKPSSF